MLANYFNNKAEELNIYDPIMLVKKSKKKFTDIKIDVGLDDEFLKDLYIDDFVEACNSVDQKLTLNKHKGYDHGYYFIHSFIEQHIEYHASNLKNIKLI